MTETPKICTACTEVLRQLSTGSGGAGFCHHLPGYDFDSRGCFYSVLPNGRGGFEVRMEVPVDATEASGLIAAVLATGSEKIASKPTVH